MMTDGSEVLQLAPCCGVGCSLRGVRATRLAINAREHLVTEERVKSFDAASRFIRSRMARHYVRQVDREDVRDRDPVGIPAASSRLFNMLAREVGGEGTFRSDNIVCKTARASLAAPVADDPHRFSSATSPQPQPDSFTATRHSSLIRSMFASVV